MDEIRLDTRFGWSKTTYWIPMQKFLNTDIWLITGTAILLYYIYQFKPLPVQQKICCVNSTCRKRPCIRNLVSVGYIDILETCVLT
jgi:hypothetical protein